MDERTMPHAPSLLYHMRIQLTTIDQLSQYHNDENLALHVLNLVLQPCEACQPRCVGFCTSTTQRLGFFRQA